MKCLDTFPVVFFPTVCVDVALEERTCFLCPALACATNFLGDYLELAVEKTAPRASVGGGPLVSPERFLEGMGSGEAEGAGTGPLEDPGKMERSFAGDSSWDKTQVKQLSERLQDLFGNISQLTGKGRLGLYGERAGVGVPYMTRCL